MSTGVRFVGKDPDGIAKAVSVNDDGVLLVELLGSLLVGEVAENPTANTILGRMKSLESKIDTLGVAIDSILAKIIASPATEAKQTALEALVGTLTDTAVNDPTASGTIIALLKGLITQMQGDGASGKSMPVQLYGSYVPQKYPIVDNNFIFKGGLGQRPFGIDKNGRIYSYTDTVLQYSDDQMANNTTLYSFSENGLRANRLSLVTLLDSGRILASLRETSQTPEGRALYLSNKFTDQSDITFTKVLQLSASKNTIYNRFGFDFHGEILLVGEYSSLYGRYVYMSTDGGETWKTIFDYENYIVNPNATRHIHDVCYDPYHGGIWVVTGDSTNKNIFYSFDFGTTWKKIYEEPEIGDMQYLSVSATPYSIILGTDDPESGYHVIRKDFATHKIQTFTRGDIEKRYVTHDQQSTIYMSKYGMHDGIWYGYISQVGNPTIVASVDGYHFYDIFTFPDKSSFSMMNMFFDDNNIYSWMTSVAADRNLLIVPKPKFVDL